MGDRSKLVLQALGNNKVSKEELSELRAEMKLDMDEINWDEIREQIKEDLEEARIYLDSIRIEMDM